MTWLDEVGTVILAAALPHDIGLVASPVALCIALGQTTGITHKKASATIIEQLAYTYDDAGNRKTVTENGGDVSTWTYDNANQLTVEQRSGGSAYTTTYTYDDVGNRATMVDGAGTTTYTYNTGNRLTLITDPSSNLTTNTYDNNGNLTITNANGTVTTNTWTYENRLRTVTLATPATTTFTYDGDGLRRQTVTAAGTTNFIWDGQDVLLETDVSNNTQVTYTQTPDIYGNLVSQRRSTTTKHYHFDALGSTLALTDANEDVTDTYKYYAFGGSLTSTGTTVNNLRFVGNLGYYNESALSLQYLRARYYQPSTGRFVSVDPARDGVNWYAYANNNPPNRVDPSGAKAISIGKRCIRIVKKIYFPIRFIFIWICPFPTAPIEDDETQHPCFKVKHPEDPVDGIPPQHPEFRATCVACCDWLRGQERTGGSQSLECKADCEHSIQPWGRHGIFDPSDPHIGPTLPPYIRPPVREEPDCP